MMYNVYFCNPVDTVLFASFEREDDAILCAQAETAGKQQVCSSDTDNGNNHFWMEVYNGVPVSPNGDLKEPVFQTKYFYY